MTYGTHDRRLPLEHIIASRAGAARGWWVAPEVNQFLSRTEKVKSQYRCAVKGRQANRDDDIVATATGGDNLVNPSSGSKTWDITKGTLKTALDIAAAVIPEPFKGAAEVLLRVVDVVEV